MKRTKKLDLDSPSKISIQPDVGMITKKDHLFSEGLIQFLLINVIALSSIITGLSYIDTSAPVFLLMCISLLISALLCFASGKVTKAGTAIIGILLFILLKNAVVKGAFVLTEQYAQLLEVPFKAPFEPDTVLSDETTVAIFLMAYLLLMLLVLYYSVFLTKNFIFTFAVSFIMPEIGLYNGNVPNYLSAFMLVAAWVCVFAMQLNDYHANRAGKKNVFTRQKKKNVFYMTERGMKNSAFGQLCIQLCIFMAAALLLAVAGSTFAGYRRSDRINAMRKDLTYDFSVKTIVNTLRELSGLRLPEIKSSIDLLGSAAVSGGMAKGDLSKVNNIRFSGKKLMEITFDTLPSGTTYLRGFAAGNYSDSRWRNASVDRENYSFDALHIMSSVNTAIESNSMFNKYYNRLQIKDLTKSGILFAPYFSAFEGLKSVNNVSYDYLTTKSDLYALDYIRFNESPEELYETYSSEEYSGPNITDYFLISYHLQRSDNPGISPAEVLEGLPINNILKMPSTEEALMSELIDGMNIYLNYGEEQASLLAFMGERTEGDTIDERYTINLNHIDEYGQSLQNEIITFDDLVYMAYDTFISNYDVDSLADDVKYMNYAFENYTNVDIDLDENVISTLNEILEDYPYDSILLNNDSFISDYVDVSNIVILTIKEYFNEHYSYSLQNPKTPSGRDFIEYFLGDMDTGSCTYFSSAAVELLRRYGIPARYAEGFMITLDQFRSNAQKNSETGQYSMDVLDNYAHAWVEIYMPGIGWLPVDFTVGVQQSVNDMTSQGGEETSATTTTAVTTTTSQTQSETSVTTAPQGGVSQTDTTTVSGGNTSTESSGDTKIKGILLAVCAAALIIAMFVLAYLACISAIRRGLKDSISEKNENRRAVNIYDLVLMYLACIGIRCSENISDKDRCEKLCAMLAEAGIVGLDNELRAACELAVKAGMSGGEITPEENEQMMALLKKVRDVCYEKMSKAQRFTAKYIKGLY